MVALGYLLSIDPIRSGESKKASFSHVNITSFIPQMEEKVSYRRIGSNKNGKFLAFSWIWKKTHTNVYDKGAGGSKTHT